MSEASRSFCPTCAQEIGGRGLLEAAVISLKADLMGAQELHRREVELRTMTEKVRDGQMRVIIDIQRKLDEAEEALQVLGLKLLRLGE